MDSEYLNGRKLFVIPQFLTPEKCHAFVEWSDEREGYNPKLQQKVMTSRRCVKVNQELPMGDEYGRFIEQLLR